MLHKDLDVWKKSMELAKEVYICTNSLPKVERFGLSSQMRRAAVSVPANIAEGAARKSTKDYLRFLQISYSSLSELDTYLILLQKLKYSREEDLPIETLVAVRKMLYRLLESLQRRNHATN